MAGSIDKCIGNGGTTYRVRVEYPPDPVTGKRRQRTKVVKTKREAEKELTRWTAEIDRGTAVDTTKQTVAEFLRHWLDTVAKHRVRPTTLEDYRATIENHIIPALGGIAVQRLTPAQVQAFYSAKRGEFASGTKGPNAGNGARTVQLCHRRLSQALAQGMKWGTVSRNVCDAVDSPSAPPKRGKTWAASDVRRFLAVAEKDRWGALWVAALTTGARQGELLALRWRDVDFSAATVLIRQSLAVLDAKPVIQAPKTRAGERTIAVDPGLLSAFRAQRERQDLERGAFDPVLADLDLVFTTALGGPLHPSNVHRAFHALIDEAGVPPITFHEMRHTHASLLIGNHVDIPTVSKRLGHAKSSITMDTYAHIIPGTRDRVVDLISSLLFGEDEPPPRALSA